MKLILTYELPFLKAQKGYFGGMFSGVGRSSTFYQGYWDTRSTSTMAAALCGQRARS